MLCIHQWAMEMSTGQHFIVPTYLIEYKVGSSSLLRSTVMILLFVPTLHVTFSLCTTHSLGLCISVIEAGTFFRPRPLSTSLVSLGSLSLFFSHAYSCSTFSLFPFHTSTCPFPLPPAMRNFHHSPPLTHCTFLTGTKPHAACSRSFVLGFKLHRIADSPRLSDGLRVSHFPPWVRSLLFICGECFPSQETLKMLACSPGPNIR